MDEDPLELLMKEIKAVARANIDREARTERLLSPLPEQPAKKGLVSETAAWTVIILASVGIAGAYVWLKLLR